MSSVELPKYKTVTLVLDAEKERQRQKKYRKKRYENDPVWREHIQTLNREKYRLKKSEETSKMEILLYITNEVRMMCSWEVANKMKFELYMYMAPTLPG